MNTDTQQFTRTDYPETINAISVARSVRAAGLDFLAPIGMVCVLGCIARCVQSWLMS